VEESAKNTILVVDDDKMCITFLCGILNPHYTLYVAMDGKSAIEVAYNNMPDLILSDIDMPEMNGIELIKALHLSDATKKIPFIFFTGRDTAEDKEKGFRLGAVDYIPKNILPDVLRQRIQKQIEAINIARGLNDGV